MSTSTDMATVRNYKVMSDNSPPTESVK